MALKAKHQSKLGSDPAAQLAPCARLNFNDIFCSASLITGINHKYYHQSRLLFWLRDHYSMEYRGAAPTDTFLRLIQQGANYGVKAVLQEPTQPG